MNNKKRLKLQRLSGMGNCIEYKVTPTLDIPRQIGKENSVRKVIEGQVKESMADKKIIRKWSDLDDLESDTHTIDVEPWGDIDDPQYSYWINPKNNKTHNSYYLSTHFFYKESGKDYDETLRHCGFNVIVERY